MASRAMREVLCTQEGIFEPWTVILDLPPMLLGMMFSPSFPCRLCLARYCGGNNHHR